MRYRPARTQEYCKAQKRGLTSTLLRSWLEESSALSKIANRLGLKAPFMWSAMNGVFTVLSIRPNAMVGRLYLHLRQPPPRSTGTATGGHDSAGSASKSGIYAQRAFLICCKPR